MEDANVSITALASEMKLSYQAVKKTLGGGSKAFNAANNDAAARILNVSSTWLATGRGPKQRPSASGLHLAQPAEPYSAPTLSDQALSLAQRLDALENAEHARLLYATMSNMLDVYEAEQRAAARAPKQQKTATPAKRAQRRTEDQPH